MEMPLRAASQQPQQVWQPQVEQQPQTVLDAWLQP
jgi:hypothetical protein